MPRSNSSIDRDITLLAIILALIVAAIYLIVTVIYFIHQWITANWNTIILIIEIIIAIGIFSVILYIIYYFKREVKRKEQEEAEKIRNVEIQQENEIKRIEWEKAERIRNVEIQQENEIKRIEWEKAEGIRKIAYEETLRKEMELKATLFYRVIETIEKFQPTKKWGNEDSYHKELQGFLRAHFPNTKFEVQTGASRPDIVIENIAIEIKGPTDNQALQSLTDKCLRYSRYYKNMIIVLFEPRFSEGRFSELKKGMEEHFPLVKIIRK